MGLLPRIRLVIRDESDGAPYFMGSCVHVITGMLFSEVIKSVSYITWTFNTTYNYSPIFLKKSLFA